MRPIIALPLSLLLLAVGAAGCGRQPAGDAGGSDPGADALSDRTFLSTSEADSVTDQGEPRPLVPGSRIRLAFQDGQIHAHAGCNSLSGDLVVEGDRLVVTGLGGTEMACEPKLMRQDKWLTEFLTGTPRWRVDGNTLTLTRGQIQMTLTDRRVADPDRPLRGARWVVDGLLHGETVSSAPDGAEAHLTFGDTSTPGSGDGAPDGNSSPDSNGATDGSDASDSRTSSGSPASNGSGGTAHSNTTVTGDTGCNQFSAKVAISHTTITFSGLVATKKACAGAAGELEKEVLAVLRGTVTYEIESDQLTVTAKSGKGLLLRAD